MTTMHTTAPSHGLFERGDVRRNRGLGFAATLYLAVAIVELTIIAVAAHGLGDFGALYVTVT